MLTASFTPFVAQAQAITEPGGTPTDVAMSINQPFEYAWKLFFYLHHQAKLGAAGEADQAKQSIREYDDDKPVVWETWAAATGGLGLAPGEANSSEVYRSKGMKPTEWAALKRQAAQPKIFEPNLTTIESSLKNAVMPQNLHTFTNTPGINPFFITPADLLRDDEIRLNKATYNHVRDNYLYSAEGLKAAYHKALTTANRDVITFPLESKEIKAKWIQIKEGDKPRYHWRGVEVVSAAGVKTKQIWGLSGLHIITKDLPNWFWCDFQHVDDEPDAISEGRPSVDPTTREQFGIKAPSGENGLRNETKGSKWQYYRLRGVQVDFTDKFGASTQLANTKIEPISEGPSSCITCHSKATAGGVIRPNARPPFVIRTIPVTFVDGLPDPKQFLQSDGKPQFIQTDFLWSMPFRVHSETEQ